MRLTRAEQQRLTRERLLDAGRAAFLERGYLAATVEEIAVAAGYTRGAVYKQFGGKEGLWQAIIDARAEGLVRNFADALDRVSGREGLLAVLTPPPGGEVARWALVSAEAVAAMSGNPGHASKMAALQDRFDTEITILLERHCARLGVIPAVPLPHLVLAWGAMGAGLALRQAIHPETDAAAVTASMLGALFPRRYP
ncbi:TetR/AcrR family transcriptional regulator [Actinoplanes sp. NPDC049802]|uniref:TetR/AcrR family transcriptional regulator n=1 Tax=Actinoplanes sp. NPDC049802 TaxID=3154742 RepID=UPI00340B8ADE